MAPNPIQPLASDPPDLDASIDEVFHDIVTHTRYHRFLETCTQVLTLAETSVTEPKRIQDIRARLDQIPTDEFEPFIHILNITMFIRTLDDHPNQSVSADGNSTPVTHAAARLLNQTTVATALELLPNQLIDVLTAHPVDMDRGLVTNTKRHLVEMIREWTIQKRSYRDITDEATKITARTALTSLSHAIRDTLIQLIHTPNYRKNKIRPESEQRNLSRAVKANERKITTHWPRLVRVLKFVFLEAAIHELITKNATLKSTLTPYLNLPRTKENLDRLCALEPLQKHPSFDDILTLPHRLTYSLQTWRGDMDGNPFVTGQTIAMSTSYGRKRCFERLSADDAVIRYSPETPEFDAIESELAKRLTTLKTTGTPAWKTYIEGREAADWTPVQTYSGLTYYRMVEMTEAAEKYSRTKRNRTLLQIGFKTDEEFLDVTAPLETAEKITGIQMGTWTRLRRLVKTRGLSLGLPHARNGEKFHLDLIETIIEKQHPKLLKKPFATASIKEKTACLKALIHTIMPGDSENLSGFPAASKRLAQNYKTLIDIQPNANIVQSDSGSLTQDIQLSILVMKTLSKWLGHTGHCIILCEDNASMNSAIQTMATAPPSLFERVIMMCAGSDNQKKSGPFYSAYINDQFLKTADHHNIPAFFGVGDSPLRSSTIDPKCHMKTFQPGSRKQFFFGDAVYPYLSHRLANQIDHITSKLSASAQETANHHDIAQALGEEMLNAYTNSVATQTDLHQAIKSISEIVTTYFSRPSKKYASTGPILEKIRAIDSGRAQLILNTFDPQLSGISTGLSAFHDRLNRQGITTQDKHHFFNTTALGQSILATLTYFAHHLDDTLPAPPGIRTVSAKDVAQVYTKLCGKKLVSKTDPYLRLSRLVWQHVSTHPEKQPHQAVAMMMFGANWMI